MSCGCFECCQTGNHYNDVIMGAMASQITIPTIICSTVCSGADQRKHQSSASLAFVRWIHRGPVNSPHKWPVTRKMFSFDDIIMETVPKQQFCKSSNNVLDLGQVTTLSDKIQLKMNKTNPWTFNHKRQKTLACGWNYRVAICNYGHTYIIYQGLWL